MQWTCPACQHSATLSAFFDWNTREYACPQCRLEPSNLPTIRLTDKKTGEVIKFWTPTPKQVEAHLATQRNVMYGGRAGTGKSVWLRNEAYMRCLTVPGYRVLLLRRQFTELRDTHLDKAAQEAQMLGAVWRATEYTVVFPNGSRLRFGHCENDDSVRQYLSSEFDAIFFDEGATFSEYQIRFIKSRLRTAKRGVIPIVRIGSNPGLPYLYRCYIAKDVTIDEDPGYNPDDYRFIPATRDDNPHVNIAEQEIALAGLPSEALRRMYRDGDWLAIEGQFFTDFAPLNRESRRPWHVLAELPTVDGVPITDVPWITYSRHIDWGYNPDPGVCTWVAHLPKNRFVAVKEYTFRETIARKVAEEIRERSRGLKISYTVGGHDMWMTDAQTGQSTQEIFARAGVSMRLADTDRISGWQRLNDMLRDVSHDGQSETPQFAIYGPGCPNLARTFPMAKCDPHRIGDILEQDDHWLDTARYFAMSRPVSARAQRTDTWKRFSPEVRKAMLGGPHRDVLGSESVHRH